MGRYSIESVRLEWKGKQKGGARPRDSAGVERKRRKSARQRSSKCLINASHKSLSLLSPIIIRAAGCLRAPHCGSASHAQKSRLCCFFIRGDDFSHGFEDLVVFSISSTARGWFATNSRSVRCYPEKKLIHDGIRFPLHPLCFPVANSSPMVRIIAAQF